MMVTRSDHLGLLLAEKPVAFTPWCFRKMTPFHTRFEHTDEDVSPGAYGVLLPDIGTAVELAVSGTHAGIHV